MNNNFLIHGKNPCFLCLKNKKREVYKIYTSDVNGISDFIKNNNLKITKDKIKYKTNNELTKIIGDKNTQHQGIILEVGYRNYTDFGAFLQYCEKSKENLPKLLILDEITDPHNIGAIMRTAIGFDVNYIIVTSRNSAKDSPVIAKTSAGYSEMVKLMEVTNLNRALEELKSVGYFVIGLDSSTNDNIKNLKDTKNICLVLGNEGNGIRRLVKENCDFLYKIDTTNVESLNVSVACAIAIYQLWGR
ncbi:MAG: 23S rRNA (guanosine(2251)-2'-O)-methyltransferase RlmB [Rickettsiales bacterium]|jgi:23S rRNA (guanosine2251-2'-O)-methyltransferase|nr:23S rRNA (guanosine(2251)-2'-O)-methyltransferase RlmB [Rickettsiales bacterium]